MITMLLLLPLIIKMIINHNNNDNKYVTQIIVNSGTTPNLPTDIIPTEIA